jgi:hypothetical protein
MNTDTPTKKTSDRNSQKLQNFTIKALAIVGFLSILAMGSFATISAALYTGRAFSYLASAAVSLSSVFLPSHQNTNTIRLTADLTEVHTGDTVTLSWQNQGTNNSGSYTFSYPCLPGFYFKVTTVARGTEVAYCNTEFNFINTDNTLKIIPISTKSRYVDMPATITFTESGRTSPSGSGSVILTTSNSALDTSENTVIPSSNETGAVHIAKTEGQEQRHSYTPPGSGEGGVADNPNGTADLKVSVIGVGTIDKVTGAFSATSTLKRSDRIGVRFAVENLGTKSSGQWRFNAILPTYPPFTFNSDAEPSLLPGDRIEFTIGFDQSVEGNQPVKFVIDPQNEVREMTKDNNTTAITITIG